MHIKMFINRIKALSLHDTVLVAVSFLGLCFGTLFSIRVFAEGLFIISLLDIVTGIIFMFIGLWQLYRPGAKGPKAALVVLACSFFAFLYNNTDMVSSGFLWSFLIPLCAPLFLGLRMHIVISSGYFVLLIAVTLLQKHISGTGSYLTNDILFRFFGIYGIISILSGVYEYGRKKKELELEKSESKLSGILNNITDAVWSVTWPKMDEVHFYSPSSEALLGYTAQEISENPELLRSCIFSAGQEAFELLAQQIEQQGSSEAEWQVTDSSGKVLWVHARCYLIQDSRSGSKLGCALSDITARKAAEAQLSRISDMQKLLMGISNNFINLSVDDTRAAVEESLGCIADFLDYGSACAIISSDKDPYRSTNYMFCKAGSGGTGTIEQVCAEISRWRDMQRYNQKVLVPDFSKLQSQSKLTEFGLKHGLKSMALLPLADAGDPIGYLGLFSASNLKYIADYEQKLLDFFGIMLINLISRNKLQADLVKEKQNAQAANNAKSEFLANMSHEMRTPLHGIIGFTELLIRTKLNSQQAQYARSANISGKAMLGVVSDILDFSKIEAGKLELDIARHDIAELAEQAASIVKLQAASKGLELVLDIEPAMPSIAYADNVRLRQVLVNLLGNAVKFTEKGQVVLTVTCAKEADSKASYCFTVADTGIGIGIGQREKLFSAFSQADSSGTKKYGGTGLGLAISRELVRKMGGEILLESQEGKGSSFSFSITLPYISSQEKYSHALNTLSVLVALSNQASRQGMKAYLNHIGVRNTACGDGIEAKELLSKNNYTHLFVDYELSGINGLELLETLNGQLASGDMKAMMLHSVPDPQFLSSRCSRLGAADVFLKPIDREAISLFIGTEAQVNTNAMPHTAAAAAKVLIVDDIEINLILMSSLVEESLAGAAILTARNGQEAFSLFKLHSPDIILMDIQMPVMDGIQATAEIRRHEKENNNGARVPIIAITAGAFRDDKARALAAGMDEFLAKPVEADKLEATIASYLPKNRINHAVPQQEATHFDKDLWIKSIGADMDTAASMASACHADMPRYLQQLDKSIAASDYKAASGIAHSIKGVAAIMRMPELMSCAAGLENCAGNNDATEIKRLGKQVNAEWGLVAAMLRKML
jgi:PAS domain S-box-containing protein